MRAFFASALLLWPLIAFAETRSMDHLTKEGFVGTWEAIIQDDSMATGVYQMVVPTKGDATLIQLFAGGKSMFFGRAASWELAEGKIKIRFTMDPKHVHYYDWIEIQGSAVGRGRRRRHRWKAHKAPHEHSVGRVERACVLQEGPLGAVF